VIPFLSEQWAAEYRADLLARLMWELDAGWRTVSPVPEPEPEPAVVIARRELSVVAVERVRSHSWARPHLRTVA
jgi:hypothetical protein